MSQDIANIPHPPRGKSYFRKSFRFLFGISLSGICIYFLWYSIEQEEVIYKFKNVNLTLLFYALLVSVFSYIVRTIRWRYFFKENNFSFLVLYRALILGFFMNNVLPARIGEFVRCHSLGRRTGLSRTFILATVAAERLADGLMISAIFGVFFYLSSLTIGDIFYIGLVSLFFLGASIAVIVTMLVRQPIFRLIHKVEKKLNNRVVRFVISKLEKFVNGLEPILEKDLALKLVLLSIVVWSVELFAYYLISLAFSQHLDIGELGLFLASVNFASLIPAAPGGVGVIESVASSALKKSGLNHETALAMVVAQHAIQYLAVGIPGIYFAIRNSKDTKIDK